MDKGWSASASEFDRLILAYSSVCWSWCRGVSYRLTSGLDADWMIPTILTTRFSFFVVLLTLSLSLTLRNVQSPELSAQEVGVWSRVVTKTKVQMPKYFPRSMGTQVTRQVCRCGVGFKRKCGKVFGILVTSSRTSRPGFLDEFRVACVAWLARRSLRGCG